MIQAVSRSTRIRRLPATELPDRWSTALFGAKIWALRLRRGVRELGTRRGRLGCQGPEFADPVGLSRTALWSDARAGEAALQLGKVHNLRVAARSLDGLAIPAGAVFSFWRQVGWPGRPRGFVPGRMLQQGCMVPAVAGGLCQLSNAIYDVALQAGCEIVERHAHSRIVPGSAAASGRDATVAWNYVDLRFRTDRPMRLDVRLGRDDLVVTLRAGGSRTAQPVAGTAAERAAAHSCASCGQAACFRHETGPAAVAGRTAFMMDEAWPELLADVAGVRQPGEALLRPALSVAAAMRGLRMRRAAAGAATRRAQVAGTEAVAQHLARRLGADVTRLCVAQSLLPTLWREGHLGGQSFSVLLTRLPLHLLHARLDAASADHPDRPSLADFRASQADVDAEVEALAQAEAVITPHAELAALFPGRARKLAWAMPRHAAASPARRRIAFPGPTLARKGAWEVREAARTLDLEVVLCGAELEGARFWDGVRTVRGGPDGTSMDGAWMDGVAAVVQPAWVEDQPRRLLTALAAGLPVIATPACGLDAGFVPVRAGDAAGLIAALRDVLDCGPTGIAC